MRKRLLILALPALFTASAVLHSASFGQEPEADQQLQLQQKVAAVKQAIAQNQQALHQYTWTETTEMILKGETKSQKQASCSYGPDGKVVKKPLGVQSEPQKKRGLRGKIIEKKKGEMQDYMERVASLIHRYVPPEGARLQDSYQAGKAVLQLSSGGTVTLIFNDYAKAGDNVTLVFDAAARKIQRYAVKSYLDAPEDTVTLDVQFAVLPDGTSYVARTILDATAKQIQIRTTNSDYQK